MSRSTRPPTTRRRSRAATAVASLLPLAISMIPARAPFTSPTQPSGSVQPTTAARRSSAAKEFSIPISNLQDWAGTVVVTLENVRIEGHSNVHRIDADCELHLGAHTPDFRGNPDGLVLEPMNACIQPFPGKSEQKNADWTGFANRITGTTVIASGVPRIWPEHLSGGGGPSNPDHAVELHPLTAIVSAGQSLDFAPNVFAGEYRGGVGETTALSIVQNTTVSVTRNSGSVNISFSSGRIGNFTLLDIVIERASIQDDGEGSYRMNGEVIVDNSTAVPVRIVTVKGSPVNDEIERIQAGRRESVSMEQTLVLFSLSPEALLEATNRSNGALVVVDRPIQLILYGTPE